MTGSFDGLIAAAVVFVGAHFLLSSLPVRQVLIARLTVEGFRVLYAVVALASLIWLLVAYNSAPYEELWVVPGWTHWVPIVVMPFALILFVAGLTTPSPTAVGGEKLVSDSVAAPVRGIQTITRHPFLWGVALWALSHLLVNGDLATVILLLSLLILCFGGMWHIDLRRERSLGAAWGPIKLTTSVVPLAAVVAKRTTIDWRGIGWWRPLAGVIVFLAFMHLHQMVIGVSPLPY